MKRLFWLVLACSCSASESDPAGDTTPTAMETGDSLRAPAAADTIGTMPAPDAGQREIFIDAVTTGNPVVVRGRARTFENTVQVRARDADGALIAMNFTTSAGEMGHHNPYEAQLWLVRDPGSRMFVDAFEYSAKDGSERSLTTDTLEFAGARMPVTLMFSADECTATKSFDRQVPRTVAVARLLVEALVAGPTAADKAAGASAPFPPGSRVNTVRLRDGELTVDFNERLQNVGGSCAAQAIRASVTHTLERLPAVRRVVISAGGSRDLALQP
ncbi:MAG: Gmad2 immunoglobulin-like domain-containing protein [Gemmatimonadaceae bacterium]